MIGFAYDHRNQRTSETWYASTSATTANNATSYAYQEGGALYTAADAFDSSGSFTANNSAFTFGIGVLGRVTSLDNQGGLTSSTTPGVPRVVLTSQYDLNGNRTVLSAAMGSGSRTADFQDAIGYGQENDKKRGRDSFHGVALVGGDFFGRPRARSVASRPKRLAIDRCQSGSPSGLFLRTARRTASKSASVCGSLTCSTQARGRGNGQRASNCRSSAEPNSRRHRLDQRQAWACATNPARNAFRST